MVLNPNSSIAKKLLKAEEQKKAKRRIEIGRAFRVLQATINSRDHLAVELALRNYERTGDHDHGRGPILVGGACPGGDCIVAEARKRIAVLKDTPAKDDERAGRVPGHPIPEGPSVEALQDYFSADERDRMMNEIDTLRKKLGKMHTALELLVEAFDLERKGITTVSGEFDPDKGLYGQFTAKRRDGTTVDRRVFADQALGVARKVL